MRRLTVAAASILLACGTAAAGPLRGAWVDADAQWLLHLDCEGFRASAIGKFILEDGGLLIFQLIMAWLASIAMEPAVGRLAQYMRRGVATGLVMIAVVVVSVGFLAAFGNLLADQIRSLVTALPAAVEALLDWLNATFDLSLDAEALAAQLQVSPEQIAAIGAEVPLWSSTSNFPMTRLAAGMAHPERAIVLHPVQTQLIIFVEVVPGERTSEATVATTLDFCADVGLRAVQVRKEIPGFLWNRVWFAMLREMLHLVDIGAVEPRELDSLVQTTLRAFVPVFGPLQMTDLIGHDTLRDISNALYPELAADRSASTTIEDHVAAGLLGVKSGEGFYEDDDERVGELAARLSRIALELGEESRGPAAG